MTTKASQQSQFLGRQMTLTAESTINQEQIVVADVDLDLLDEQRVNGSVIPLQDLIKDAYDNVVHFSDYKGQPPVGTENPQEGTLKPVVCL